ncbi:Ig-like domain-containing protein [Flavitalea flava]
MKRILPILLLILGYGSTSLQAQTASFNFSATSKPVSGWTNVAGDPSVAVRSATSSGFTISSVSTANWVAWNGTQAANDGSGMASGTFFPAGVMVNEWFQYGSLTTYNAAVPQLQISGLNVDSVYTLKMTTSFSGTSFDLSPTRYTVTGATVYGYSDLDANNNTANGAIFTNIAPNASGVINVYVNTVASLSNTAGIAGLQITRGRTASPVPVVLFTSPANGDVIPEDGNITIAATASEVGGTITKVEFYANNTKIGESATSPYSLVWYGPDAGVYTLKARAIDGLGNTNTTTINISVESLSSFWSTTGNIATGGDTSFVGTVDSNRLAFRTKNIERMSILPTGNIGIGTKTPTAQFHTTGTVRLAALTSDSTKSRVLVSDTSGNLFYRTASSLTGRWQYAGGVVYDSADNIGIGTSNTQGYKLAVNGTAIFTKVKVKTAGTWPDYVFKKGYQLPDLAEIERYVSEHKHLPGIASEQEVQANGIDVGAHQAALLKKIEELTLYLIQEHKKLNEQTQAIKLLQEQRQQLQEQNQQLQQQNKVLDKQQQEIEELKRLIKEKK